VVLAFPQPCVAAAAALRGETPSLTTLSGAHMDETAFVQAFGPVPLAMGLLRAVQATLHGLAGNYEETLALAADPGLALSPPLCLQPALCFWRGLAALRLAAASQGERRSELLALGRECSDFLSQVTKQGAPDNVTHRIRMLRAERERAEGRTAEVAGTLQQAADLAARNGFVLEQGFCLESLGLWLLEDAPAGAAGPARASLQQAAQCYGQAQALLLQRRVEERLAALADSAPADSAQEDSVRPDPGDSGELERQLAARGQQVLQLQLELQQAREQLEQAARAKAGFLVSMGHEIRTPMNAIIGLSHLALKNAHDAQQRDYLNKIRQSGQQLLGVLNDILDFTKVEAGRLDMEIIPFELDTVFETLAGITAEKVNAKGLELFWQVAPDVPRNLIGDPLRLGQILINYTSNAIKFTERGEVGISVGVVEKDRDTVRLRFAVRDTGIGLSAQQAAQLFQSANPDSVGAMRKGGGAGLGLAICKRLAGLMGGEVGVHSTPGEGATFWFTATLGLGAQNPRPRLAADLRRKRVLVVDDNANAAAVLCEQLLVLGCKAHGLVSGHAALQEIRRAALAGEAYDVLMTDWQMPEMDGLELVGRVNASGVSPMPLKVLVTAYGKETAGPRAAGTGIAQVLQKPVSNAMLFDGLMALFGQEAPAPAFPAGAADIATTPVLDPVRGARILLVEDNESNQQVALELLTSENFLVELAVDGKQAVDRVNAALQQQRPFDLVLMDLQMPVMDGVAATRLIRSNPAHDMLPVVAMTANALQSDRQLCLRAGMNDFVAKPVEPRQLWAALVKWIAPRPGLGPEPAAGGAMTSGETAAALQSLRTHLERNDAQALEVFARLEGMLRDWVGAAQFRLVEVAMDAFELEQALELLQSAGVFSHPAGSR
jgi:signal transduction histidine kinase/DNA-binding response OmpR family regulator